MSYLPPPTTDPSGIFSLLALVSDPKNTKARLAEIAEATQGFKETIDLSRTKEQEVKKAREELEEAKKQHIMEYEKGLSHINEEHVKLDQRQKEIEHKASDLYSMKDQAEQKISRAESAISNLNSKQVQLQQYEASLKSMQDNLERREWKIKEAEERHQKRQEHLKALLS